MGLSQLFKERQMSDINRRTFIIATSAAALTLPHLASAAEVLQSSDPIAIALGYKAVAEDVDISKFPKRAGVAGAEQFCSNCALYKETAAGYGPCTAIPGKLVAGAGWCNVWVPIS
jgi:hypothetical protein